MSNKTVPAAGCQLVLLLPAACWCGCCLLLVGAVAASWCCCLLVLIRQPTVSDRQMILLKLCMSVCARVCVFSYRSES